jgi:hypothetical protein
MRRRVIYLRYRVIGDNAGYVAVAGAGHRKPWLAARRHLRIVTGCVYTDISDLSGRACGVVVGVREILPRRAPHRQHGLELRPVRRLVDPEQCRQITRRHVAHPVHGHPLPGLGHDRAVHRDVHGQLLGRRAAHRDRVVLYGHLPPRAAPVVLVATDAFGVVEGGLVLRVSERPGDMRVMPQQYPRHAVHCDTGHLVPGRGQRHLVPDRRQGLRQVRVPAEQRGAPRDRRPVRRPRVAVRISMDLIRWQLAELVKKLSGRRRYSC